MSQLPNSLKVHATRTILRVAILLPLLLLQGCTLGIWHNLVFSKVYNPEIVGVASIEPQTMGRPQFLIVSYHNNSSYDSHYGLGDMEPYPCTRYFAIPLQNGNPPAPLVYNGTERTPEAILKNLSDDELRLIKHYQFSKQSSKLGDALQKSSAFIPINSSPQGAYRNGDHYALPIEPNADPKRRLLVLPYWWIDDMIPPSSVNNTFSRNSVIEHNSKILLLPESQAYGPKERLKGGLLATSITPFSLAADAVLLPLELVFILEMIQ